ncbi:MAG: transketolase [Desulfobacteraceae bacterium]|nr:transketolase [Desulfobacteraceae bacterium]
MTKAHPAEDISEPELASINTIRTLSMDAIEKAQSGHPGAPLGMAPAAYAIWHHFMKHSPKNPMWPDRDRFVLSAGHASMMLYAVLYLTGYDVKLDDLKQFRQWKSLTPGHPEARRTPGVEVTTGPLGQGIASAVGLAMAERHLAAVFNMPGHEIVDHYTYVMCGDGDLMEGISQEAASLAGHLGLSKLICLYDDNQISIEGNTDITFTEDVGKRFEACGWQVLNVADGNNAELIVKAVETARAETEKPSMIILRTHIAYGSPNKQDSADSHGAPLGEEEVRLTKQFLGCSADQLFCVPETALAHMRQAVEKGAQAEGEWKRRFEAYKKEHPQLAEQFAARTENRLPENWDADIPVFDPQQGNIATRKASGSVLNAIAGRVPELIGGSADLGPSNKTMIQNSHDFQKGAYSGRNIRFGVREHVMGAIVNGMWLHGGLKPYCGTFLVFSDYMRPAIRMAALMHVPAIYIFTHDSLAVGEDGPTHQPVEHLAALRAIPHLQVIRPADANEAAEAWKLAMTSENKPVALILSRQGLPVIDRSGNAAADGVKNGAYIISDSYGKPDIIIIATGSEVSTALEAKKKLSEKNVDARVVSMPCWERFEQMPEEYKNQVLDPDVRCRLAVEAGLSMGWEKYVGPEGETISVEQFGVSGKGAEVMAKYGFTAGNIAEKALKLTERLKT